MVRLMQGDCLERLSEVEAGSIDAVIADPPYGSTACAWDSVIPLEPMWEALRRVVKPSGAIVLFGSQPFTSALVMSNPRMFRYELIWDKVNRYTGHLSCASLPLKRHENILVFYAALPTFNKQYRRGAAFPARRIQANNGAHLGPQDEGYRARCDNDGARHNPCSIVEVRAKVNEEQGLHPTQKPVALMCYLIRTYTNPGETVLDFCFGSGTTGEAAVKEGRHFIGVERDADFFGLAQRRIHDASLQQRMTFEEAA